MMEFSSLMLLLSSIKKTPQSGPVFTDLFSVLMTVLKKIDYRRILGRRKNWCFYPFFHFQTTFMVNEQTKIAHDHDFSLFDFDEMSNVCLFTQANKQTIPRLYKGWTFPMLKIHIPWESRIGETWSSRLDCLALHWLTLLLKTGLLESGLKKPMKFSNTPMQMRTTLCLPSTLNQIGSWKRQSLFITFFSFFEATWKFCDENDDEIVSASEYMTCGERVTELIGSSDPGFQAKTDAIMDKVQTGREI